MKENLRTTISVYLILLFGVLPLYMPEGFTMIGEMKYRFFRNITLFFICIVTIMLVLNCFSDNKVHFRKRLSLTDYFALIFAGCSIVSFILSDDKYMAFFGCPGWNMGLLSQLLFIWIYFAVSRIYEDSKLVEYSYVGSVILVMLLGILNKYRIDPLGTFDGLDEWNTIHLLSTIGNPNWYCGYVSVGGAVCIAYAYGATGIKKLLGYIGVFLFYLTIMTQGSEGGYLIISAFVAVMFYESFARLKNINSAINVFSILPASAMIGKIISKYRWIRVAEDGSLKGVLYFDGWMLVFIVLIIGSLVLYFTNRKEHKNEAIIGNILQKGMVICIVLTLTLLVICQFSDSIWSLLGERKIMRITDEWGNYRGMLWRASWGCYLNGGLKQLIIGVGPDCFSRALYDWEPAKDILLSQSGQWKDAFYANAHNEFLNMLICEGLFGAIAYIGIFIASFIRAIKKESTMMVCGVLAIAGYVLYGTVSFQQVTSTPLIFALLGLMEANINNNIEGVDGHERKTTK